MSEQSSMLTQVAQQVSRFAKNPTVIFTEKFILSIVLLIIVVDVFLAFFNNVEDDTVSEVLQGWAYNRFAVLSWAWGVLAGHLFLARVTNIFDNSALAISVLLIITLLLFLVGFVSQINSSVIAQLFLLIAGTVAGYLLWPQNLPPSVS